ncbi:MAG: hypothetical protein JXA00_04860 [Candidatus Thermoplasmatota archaeon]|nr:hypothetical protein [Candidatus Thermoplasmatota archaeon]
MVSLEHVIALHLATSYVFRQEIIQTFSDIVRGNRIFVERFDIFIFPQDDTYI